jgi:Arc/MetJ-type ribon-helix-helix transcriptional regulator
MKTLTVRLPETLVDQIEAESRARRLSKSDVVRERLSASAPPQRMSPLLESIQDLIGSVEGQNDVSANKKAKLRALGYGRKRSR